GLSRPVTSYGPAPVGYFTANSPLPNLAGPVAAPTTAYDEALNGLSAARWDDTLAPAGTPAPAALAAAPQGPRLLTGPSSWAWGGGTTSGRRRGHRSVRRSSERRRSISC